MSQASDFRLQKKEKLKEKKNEKKRTVGIMLTTGKERKNENWKKMTENEEKKPIIKSPTKSVNLNGQIC